MKLKIGITDIILFVLSVLLCVGSFTFFKGCDTTTMSCHWAQVTVTALGVLLSVISLAAALIPDRRVKSGLDLAAVLTAVLTAIVPQNLIPLCMMQTMHCRSVFQPAVILVASLTAVSALAAAVYNLRKKDL